MNLNNQNIILIDKNINLIQELRALQALSESNYFISIDESQKVKFELLKSRFGMDFKVGILNGISISEILEVNHCLPITKIGGLNRALIFPNSITDYCKTLWVENRKYKFTFTGLITTERCYTLTKWIENNFKFCNPNIPITNKLYFRLKMKLLSNFSIKDFFAKQYGELFIWSSNRGRVFPKKSWDEDYYRILSNSKFVLCPSGDYTWTYRFFESILCGAIPVVEKKCDAYEGFIYRNMEENPNNFLWTIEDAVFNYQLCIEKITIPILDLNKELEVLFKRNI
jgi:hypothetical protein